MTPGDLVRMTTVIGEVESWERQDYWGHGIVAKTDTNGEFLVEIHWFKWGLHQHIKEAIEVLSEAR